MNAFFDQSLPTLYLRTYSQYTDVYRAKTEFSDRVKASQATIQDLVQYILTIDISGSQHQSMGMNWIWQNPMEFVRLVGDVKQFFHDMIYLAGIRLGEIQQPTDPLSIQDDLREWFFKSYLCSTALMNLLSSDNRSFYVRCVYPCCGAADSSWISAATIVGVPAEAIAMGITCRMEFYTKDHPEAQREMRDFLDPRKFGSIDPESIWGKLIRANMLDKALLICAKILPGQTIHGLNHPWIKENLTEGQIKHVAQVAAGFMYKLSGTNTESLERELPLSERIELAKRLQPVRDGMMYAHETARFLFKIMTELPQQDQEQFWFDVVDPRLAEMASHFLYKTWRQMKIEHSFIDQHLQTWLEEDGFKLGTIEQICHPHTDTRLGIQIGRTTYVQRVDAHRYSPVMGDLVMFCPNSGVMTAHNLVGVHFIPVLKN